MALMEMYLRGVPTGKVAEVTEALCSASLSKSHVSSLAGRLDVELEAWRSCRPEAKTYPYLLVDARYGSAGRAVGGQPGGVSGLGGQGRWL